MALNSLISCCFLFIASCRISISSLDSSPRLYLPSKILSFGEDRFQLLLILLEGSEGPQHQIGIEVLVEIEQLTLGELSEDVSLSNLEPGPHI